MKRFVVVGNPGGGADVLQRLVSSQPSLQLYGELFHPSESERELNGVASAGGTHDFYAKLNEDAYEFLARTIWNSATVGPSAVGFIMLTERVDCPGTKNFYARLRQIYPDVSVIHVKRQNLLDAYCERQQPSNVPSSSDTPDAKDAREAVAIRRSNIEEFFIDSLRMSEFFPRHFGDQAYLEVAVEALQSDPQGTLNQILSFLDLPASTATPSTLELPPPIDRKKTIIGYERIKELFQTTIFKHYFNDGEVSYNSLSIHSQNEFSIAGLKFLSSGGDYSLRTNPDRVVILKPAGFIHWYLEYFATKNVQNVLEFGVWQGGSPLALTYLLDLKKFVGIDISEPVAAVDTLIHERGLSAQIHLHWDTSQSDVVAVRNIIDQHFGPTDLDLIIDDASHRYEHTLKAFETAFPRLRPGGHYIIEDWGWSHWPGFEKYAAGVNTEKSLTTLIFELTMACASAGNIIGTVAVHPSFVVIRKGVTAPALSDSFTLARLIKTHARDFVPL